MKILIVYASAGAGHFKAAEAVYKYLKNRCPGAKLDLIDILPKTSAFIRFNYRFGYQFLINKALFLWSLSFWSTDSKLLRPLVRPLSEFINRINTRPFADFLIKEDPDYIISTHFLPPEIAVRLKRSGRIHSKIVTVITDFGVHNFWLHQGTDLYVAALASTKDILLKNGIRQELIGEFGIPVDEKFLQPQDKGALCRKLGLAEGKFTVLIMTGSFGIGPIEEIIGLLNNKAQLLVVCASNKKLYSRLSGAGLADTKVYGFVDNVHELMSVSDCIVTKPGGLSISEILVAGIVPVFVSAIPGQEHGNLEAMQKCGVGMAPKHLEELAGIILGLKDDPEKLARMKEAIARVRKPDTLRNICDVVCPGCSRNPC